MAYLLDANVFIQAKNLHYGLDFCPALWEWLIAGNQAKRVFSIEKISDEIAAGVVHFRVTQIKSSGREKDLRRAKAEGINNLRYT